VFVYQDLDTPFSGSRELDNFDDRRTQQRLWLAQAEWGLTERLSVNALVPYRDVSASGRINFNDAGLGDIQVGANWRLGAEGKRFGGAVGGGLALPTGDDAQSGLTSENVVFGAGDFSLLASVEGFRRLATDWTVFGLARYRRPLGAGDDDYRFGDDIGWVSSVRWQVRGGPVSLMSTLSGQHLGRDHQHGASVDSRGGRMHHAGVGVGFPVGGGLSGSLLAQRLIEKDVRGDQLLAEWQFIVGLNWTWGSHEHGE